jgi:hypothetical protein
MTYRFMSPKEQEVMRRTRRKWFDTGIRVPNPWYKQIWRKWRTLFMRD